MDNFRKPKKGHKNSLSNVEGFVRRPVATDKLRVKSTFEQSKKEKPSERRLIGDFKHEEGFSPRQTKSVLPDGRSLGRQPMIRDKSTAQQSNSKRKRLRGPHNWKKIALRGGLACIIVVLLIGGYLVGKGYLRARQVFKGGGNSALLDGELDPSQLRGEGDGRINILLLGRGGDGHEGADLTDTILVASIDPINKDAGLLSLPRDLYVRVPDSGSMKINAIYATKKQEAIAEGQNEDQAETAGLRAIEESVQEVIGIPVHYHAMVDFEAFQRAIDTVGGVTIDVKEPLYDATMAWKNNWNPLLAPAGVQTFNGERALMYARSRYGSARGDFDRSERQRQILVGLREKVFSLGTFSNPVKISGLIDAFGSHVRTNLSVDDINKLYNIGKDIDGSKTASVSLVDPPNDYVETATVGGLSVVIPKAGLYQYAEIQSFVRNTLKDGFIRKEDPRIVVLNGTNVPGLATQKAEELQSYGYNVIEVGDAPNKDAISNILVDMRDGEKRYTKRYLELRFNTAATTKLPEGIANPQDADFVIIVGPQ